ncbi:MAG: flagellar hook-associated protein FlgL [Lautropia sp.]|nr:flagellar hook-associated protein FlgL [Lautropia sp.]
MMRVATSQFRNQAITNISEQQSTIARLQQQASSGQKVNRPSDDPLAMAEAERLRSEMARNQIERRMMSYAKSQMAQSESLISSGIDILQRARDLMISARNGTMSDQDRFTIANQLRQYRIELWDLAGQRSQDGSYVFGGKGSEDEPFWPEDAPRFIGEPGIRQTGLSIPYPMTVDGSRIMQGFGADGNASIFEELDAVVQGLSRGGPYADQALQKGMYSVDMTLGLMSEQRSLLGEQMHVVDARERLLDSGDLNAKQRRSDLMDTDYAEVLSGIQSRNTALQAAMQTYSQISQLSMFNYL